MTPEARIAATIEILDQIGEGRPAEQALLRWFRGNRFAGSGDRLAIRDHVFDALRRRRSLSALGGGESGTALMIGACRADGVPLETVFTGTRFAPALPDPLPPGRAPSETEALDLPDWLLPRLRADLGADLPAIAAALRARAPVWLRVNLARGDVAAAQAALAAEGIETAPDPRCATALGVSAGARRIAGSQAWADGLVEMQDLSSQIACGRVAVSPGLRVLDYCAGGGGKALALAARGARVTAHDANPARMGDIAPRATRAGVRIEVAAPPLGPRRFDLVLVDAPCSGTGTWRRTPDAKWRLTAEALDRTLALQREIFDAAAAHVAPGGRLVWMTCSLLRAENDDQVTAFLSRHPQFRRVAAQSLTPLTASDGFFVAELELLTDP